MVQHACALRTLFVSSTTLRHKAASLTSIRQVQAEPKRAQRSSALVAISIAPSLDALPGVSKDKSVSNVSRRAERGKSRLTSDEAGGVDKDAAGDASEVRQDLIANSAPSVWSEKSQLVFGIGEEAKLTPRAEPSSTQSSRRSWAQPARATCQWGHPRRRGRRGVARPRGWRAQSREYGGAPMGVSGGGSAHSSRSQSGCEQRDDACGKFRSDTMVMSTPSRGTSHHQPSSPIDFCSCMFIMTCAWSSSSP